MISEEDWFQSLVVWDVMKVCRVYLWSQLCIINFRIETFSCGWYVKLVNQMLITRRSILLEHSEMFSKFIINFCLKFSKTGPLIIEDGMTVKAPRMKNLVTLVTSLNNFFGKALPHMDHILHWGTGNLEVCWLYPAPHWTEQLLSWLPCLALSSC